jgi:L-rhamnose isomerase / sugar isomerase
MRSEETDRTFQALEVFRIEIPSWGLANGPRFGKFTQAAAATTPEEKFSDAGQVYLTGVCPTLALHILWDLPEGIQSEETVNKLAERYGIRPGSINPHLFQDQAYKYGSFG